MKRLTLGVGVLLATLPFGVTVAADALSNYPTKAITIVVPYPPGGSTDALGRLLGEKIGAELGQPVIVENKAGASGNRSEEHTSELQSLMCLSYAVFCLKKKKKNI